MDIKDGSGNSKSRVKKVKPRYIKPIPPAVVLGKRGEHVCKWCNRSFSTEKILVSHLCEQRRRYSQRDAQHCRYGLEAFMAIQHKCFGSTHNKTEEDFRSSTLYLACCRWGRYVIDVGCWKSTEYLTWLLKLNVPIDTWAKDAVYSCWLQQLVITEDAWDSLERSIKTMQKWGEENQTEFFNYFRRAGTARVLFDIQRAMISPWVLFCCESGKSWLSSLAKQDLESIWPWVDASKWNKQFENMKEETSKITSVCSEAGL